MNEERLERLADAVLKRVFVPLEASARHVHITKEQAIRLFGHPLTFQRELSQPGQYLARERVTVIGPRGTMANVAVLGPERKEAQVEISLTDGRTLGIAPPVKPSGDVSDSPGVRLEGPEGRVELTTGVIAAQRHIHMTPEDARHWGVEDKQRVRLRVYTMRPVVFEDVLVRVSPAYATFAHLDYDEANACAMKDGDLGRIEL